MTVQRFADAVTPQHQSLKIEVRKGAKWEDAGEWRFPLENYSELEPAKMCEARLYARDLTTKQGVVDALRIIPSTDPVNYRYVGGIGNMHLEPV